jgi:hypothetical protein
MIPPFDDEGLLPYGIHDCSLQEAAARFAGFQNSDRRPQLWARFIEFMGVANEGRLLQEVLMDGSFVTAKAEPNDIDLVLVLAATHDFALDLSPQQYNLLAQRLVRRRFGFDILIARYGSTDLEQAVAFFQQVKQRPDVKKGILRLKV